MQHILGRNSRFRDEPRESKRDSELNEFREEWRREIANEQDQIALDIQHETYRDQVAKEEDKMEDRRNRERETHAAERSISDPRENRQNRENHSSKEARLARSQSQSDYRLAVEERKSRAKAVPEVMKSWESRPWFTGQVAIALKKCFAHCYAPRDKPPGDLGEAYSLYKRSVAMMTGCGRSGDIFLSCVGFGYRALALNKDGTASTKKDKPYKTPESLGVTMLFEPTRVSIFDSIQYGELIKLYHRCESWVLESCPAKGVETVHFSTTREPFLIHHTGDMSTKTMEYVASQVSSQIKEWMESMCVNCTFEKVVCEPPPRESPNNSILVTIKMVFTVLTHDIGLPEPVILSGLCIPTILAALMFKKFQARNKALRTRLKCFEIKVDNAWRPPRTSVLLEGALVAGKVRSDEFSRSMSRVILMMGSKRIRLAYFNPTARDICMIEPIRRLANRRGSLIFPNNFSGMEVLACVAASLPDTEIEFVSSEAALAKAKATINKLPNINANFVAERDPNPKTRAKSQLKMESVESKVAKFDRLSAELVDLMSLTEGKEREHIVTYVTNRACSEVAYSQSMALLMSKLTRGSDLRTDFMDKLRSYVLPLVGKLPARETRPDLKVVESSLKFVAWLFNYKVIGPKAISDVMSSMTAPSYDDDYILVLSSFFKHMKGYLKPSRSMPLVDQVMKMVENKTLPPRVRFALLDLRDLFSSSK